MKCDAAPMVMVVIPVDHEQGSLLAMMTRLNPRHSRAQRCGPQGSAESSSVNTIVSGRILHALASDFISSRKLVSSTHAGSQNISEYNAKTLIRCTVCRLSMYK